MIILHALLMLLTSTYIALGLANEMVGGHLASRLWLPFAVAVAILTLLNIILEWRDGTDS